MIFRTSCYFYLGTPLIIYDTLRVITFHINLSFSIFRKLILQGKTLLDINCCPHAPCRLLTKRQKNTKPSEKHQAIARWWRCFCEAVSLFCCRHASKMQNPKVMKSDTIVNMCNSHKPNQLLSLAEHGKHHQPWRSAIFTASLQPSMQKRHNNAKQCSLKKVIIVIIIQISAPHITKVSQQSCKEGGSGSLWRLLAELGGELLCRSSEANQ